MITDSKIMAEKTAWDFVRQDDVTFDLATINPPLVIGESTNTSNPIHNIIARDMTERLL